MNPISIRAARSMLGVSTGVFCQGSGQTFWVCFQCKQCERRGGHQLWVHNLEH